MKTAVSRYEQLDAMRGIAALLVVISHVVAWWPETDVPPQAWHRTSWMDAIVCSPLHLLWDGSGAVIFFFVLSGFVLSLGFLAEHRSGYGRYIVRRMFRLFPVLVFCVVAVWCALLLLHPVRHDDLPYWLPGQSELPVSFKVMVGHIVLVGGFFYEHLDPPVWSMEHEVRVSIIFPLLIWVARQGNLALVGLTFVSLLAAIVAGRTLDLHLFAWSLMRTFYYLPIFCAGILLAFNRQSWVGWAQRRERWQLWALLFGSLLMISMRWVVPFGGTAADLFAGAGSLSLLLLALSWPGMTECLVTPVTGWLGRISYSLYLSHVPVYAVGIYLLHGLLPLWAITLVVVPFALVVGHLVTRYIENPFMRWGRRLTEMPKTSICATGNSG
jgi:peptidoglycan/LPS O-acetylase OafA/YrhL